MKRRLLGFGTFVFVVVGCLLTQFSFADGLPNAWQVDDESTTSFLSYTNDLSPDLQIAATNATGGFDYVINARLVSGSSSAETMAMAYGLGTNRFLIWFSTNVDGDLTADLDGAATFTLTTNGTGTALYHYHEILYNPATAQASYLFDGRLMTTNWSPSTNSLNSGEIFWGAGDPSGTGTMNFHTVTFSITNTVVTAYDAGTNGNPPTAPDPALTNWISDPDVLAADITVTNISPDAVPLPTTPLPTTLNATNVAIHQATLLGSGDQGNLAATVWFEWGTDTNYGNTTPAQPLLSDTNSFNVSQTITGLAKDAAYHYRCVATNLQGIAYGQDIVFTTLAAISVTNSDDAGPGTLRQAIADSVSGDTIAIALDDTNTIALTNGQLLITNDLTIVSSNATTVIDAGGSSRVFEIASSNTVVLDSLTITNGNISDVGGGILADGGAVLTLTNCTVAGNVAGAGGGIFISTNSIVAINNSILSDNTATNNGGAIDNETNSTLTVSDSIFTGNSAQQGGALFNNFATNILNHCTLSGNSAESGGAIANCDSVIIATGLNISTNFAAAGGGIFNLNTSILTVDDSTLSGNTGTRFGGGLINTNGGTATINNSTFSGNACPADNGGGIDNWSTITLNNCTISGSPSGAGLVNTFGVAVCDNCTFSGNVALFDGGGYYAFFGTNILNNCTISGNSAVRRAGGIYENASLSLLTNTIIAGNTAVISNADVFGSISGANNFTNGNPILAPLGNYGGPTQTMPPLAGSPAINAGVDSVTNLFITDQRGFPRLASKHVDIGAVEVQPSIVINTNDHGPGSLRAIAAMTPPLIGFANTLSGQTIQLTSGQITLSNSVGLDASGLASGILIDAGGASRVFEITESNTVALESLIITNGNVSDNGGGLLVNDGAVVTLTNCTVAGNVAAAGGGIFISTNSTVAINNCLLSSNSAVGGGGGIESYQAVLIVNNSIFIGNSATNNGGAIDCETNSVLTVNNSAFSANSAAGNGGGIESYQSFLAVTNSGFTGNSATGNGGAIDSETNSVLTVNNLAFFANSAAGGGGIESYQSLLAVTDSSFTANSATNNGGGIESFQAVLTISNSTFTGNSATNNGGGIFNDSGTVTLNNCIFSSNASLSDQGGAICNFSGSLLVNECTVAGNRPGGGINNNGGTAAFNNSTVSANSATLNGGGIWNNSTIALNNCTLFGNSAGDGSNGGGVFNTSGTNTLINCTISGNSAGNGGGIFEDASSTALLTNTIVAGNTATNASDLLGPFSGANNLTAGNPLLAPFGNYGGPTLTMPPLAGSAAIDAGLDSVTNLFATDQRGFPRLSGPHVDIGAVETQLAPTNVRPVLHLNRPQPGGPLSFTFTNVPNADFTVLSSTNLSLPLNQWSILGPATQNLPGQYQFSDSTPRTSRVRFYRVVSP